jgi:UDP-2,3-diacylglucosamine pyrophosphatase LpxH
MKILPIGDAHVADDQDLRRFSLLSQFIVDQRPDHIVFMGDFMTLNCFSAWDMNKRAKMEGRRYWKEIAAGQEAIALTFEDLWSLQRDQKRQKVKVYNPSLTYLMGNHETRLQRYVDLHPEIEESLSLEKDLELKRLGFDIIPYMSYKYINDIGFTHIPFNKMREISGVNITHKAQMVTIKSTVFGHTHEFHVSNRHTEGMEHLQQTLNCGCFFEETEEYALGKLTQYWKGLVLLHSYKPGRFDMDTYSLGRLERMYAA